MPDSQLKGLCDTLYDLYGVHGQRHVVAANEGGAVGLAAGHYLATGHPALVYLQNSGLGNIVNPVCSLLHEKVYGIPCLFVVGWRGEPGVHDEPQHVFQGEVTLEQLRLMDIERMCWNPPPRTSSSMPYLPTSLPGWVKGNARHWSSARVR